MCFGILKKKKKHWCPGSGPSEQGLKWLRKNTYSSHSTDLSFLLYITFCPWKPGNGRTTCMNSNQGMFPQVYLVLRSLFQWCTLLQYLFIKSWIMVFKYIFRDFLWELSDIGTQKSKKDWHLMIFIYYKRYGK